LFSSEKETVHIQDTSKRLPENLMRTAGDWCKNSS